MIRKIKQKEQSPKIVFKSVKKFLEEQENSAGFSNKPAADFGTRTATDDDIHGDDSLQNDYQL